MRQHLIWLFTNRWVMSQRGTLVWNMSATGQRGGAGPQGAIESDMMSHGVMGQAEQCTGPSAGGLHNKRRARPRN